MNVIVFMLHQKTLGLFYKFSVLLTLLLASSFSFALTINAKVDRQAISLSETLTLTVSVDEQVAFSSPSFDELQQNFDILRQHKSNRYQSMNGKVTSITEWTLVLGPKREGQLIIPSFEYNGEFSDAVPIKVSKTGNQSSGHKDIFLEASTNKNEGFVQEQFIFTQKLFSAVNLSSFDPQPLQLQGARVELLSEFDYQTRLGNRPYVVVESRYAIYPQQSGTLLIPALKWSVGVSGGRRNIFDPFANNSGRIHRLESESIRLNIKPSPAHSGAWLPASKMSIKQSWSTDPQAMRVGEPITRHVEISADGLTAAQLPTIDLNNETTLQGKIKAYLEQPQTEDKKTNDGIIGTRRISTAIIPSVAGTLTLPEISIDWWNTEREQWQTATLAALQVEVKASEQSLNSNNANVSPGQATSPSQTVEEIRAPQQDELTGAPQGPDGALQNADQLNSSSHSTALIIYSILVSLLAALLAFMYLRLWRLNRQFETNQARQTSAEPGVVSQSHTSDILNQQDNHARYKALQEYLNQQRSLYSNFNHYYNNSDLAELIDQLERILFSPNIDQQAPIVIEDKALEAALTALEKTLKESAQSKHDKSGSVAPLYPH